MAEARLRILYSHRIQSKDGQSVHVEELVAAFRRAGHEVLVVGPSLYRKVGFGGESALVAALRRALPRGLFELVEILYNLPAFFRLRRAAQTFTPDFLYERYNLYHLAGMWLARRYRIPFCLEINSPLAAERAQFGGLRFGRLAKRLEALVWRSADRVFVVTAVLREVVAAAGVPRDRIIVTANGIDPDAFPPMPYRARLGEPVTIGFIGFVRDWHGLDTLIAGLAAERDASMRLVIAGEGPARSDLEAQAAALGVADRVEFLGLQRREAIAGLIGRFDIAVQPRAVAYASPLKIFEYMACGRAIVAPGQPNIRDILTDGETALLFDPTAPGMMWEAIRRLAADPRLREELGAAARRTLEARDYTWRGNAARITAAVAGDLARRAEISRRDFEPRRRGRTGEHIARPDRP